MEVQVLIRVRRFTVHGDLGRTILVYVYAGVKERDFTLLFLFRSELDVLNNSSGDQRKNRQHIRESCRNLGYRVVNISVPHSWRGRGGVPVLYYQTVPYRQLYRD